MSLKISSKIISNFFIVLFIVSTGFLVFSNSAQAEVWKSPAKPIINGNDYILITIGDITQANNSATITISDPSSAVKQTCNITRNEYGYGRCKYNFETDDVSGTWSYTATDEMGGNVEVGKITMSLADANSLSSIRYGQQTKINADLSYENVMPKPIVMRSVSRDLGTHTGRSNFVDIDGDGDKEIVVDDYNGRIWIWEDIDRFYNEGTMLISGTDWRTADVGTYHLSSGCVYEDFDGNGTQTIICGEYSGRLYAFSNVDMTDGYNVAYSHRTVDEGDSIRTAPVLCDIDNDGTADQVAVGVYQGYIVFYTFTDAGGFTQIHKSADLGTMHYGTRPLCADFDDDGNNEWLVQDYYGGYRFYDTPTTSTVSAGDQAPDRGSYYGYGATTDFDNDGKIEAVVPMTHGRFQLLEYDKSGTNELEEDLAYGTDTDWGSYAYGGGFLEIDDLNKNGRPDFISTDTEVQSIFTEYDPSGPDWYQTEVGQGKGNSYIKPAYVDFDGDGIKEVIVFGRYNGNVYIYKFNGEDWDLIYEGWVKQYTEQGGWGDGKIYGFTNGWLYTTECIVGDIDDDNLEEAICFPYDGNALIFEQADRVEENVSPQIYLTASLNDGNYQDPDDAHSEIRILNNGELLALKENVALGITDVVDEDNQNQGSLNPRWTDGVKSTNGRWSAQNSVDYSPIDSSGTEEAVYSRIKLGQSYRVGAIKTWHYFSDGRSYKNVIIRSTNDDTGNSCDFSTNDLLFDNSADGTNKRYGEGSQGKSVYFDPIDMSCLRDSTAGASYWTTASATSNHRTEIEIYETDEQASFDVYLNRRDDSSLAVKDDWEISVEAKDRTGNLINVSDQLTIPVTYDRLPFSVRIVGGTEYYPGEDGQIVIELKDEFNDPVSASTCTVDYYYPDASLWLDDQTASELNSTGVYYSTFTTPTDSDGVYIAIATCTDGSFTDTDSHTFHVSGILPEKVWGYTGSALDTTGNAISKIWSFNNRTLTDYATSDIATEVWGYSGRSLTTFGTLVADVWSYSTRSLTSFGTLVADVWSASTRQLTSRFTDETTPVDLAQVADISSLATSTELAQVRTDLITEINENETLITALNSITAQEVWEYSTRGLTEEVNLTDATTDEIWEYALTEIGDTGSIGLLLKDNIDASVSSRSTHTAGDVWSESIRTLTANDNFNDPTSNDIALAVWANAQRTLTDYGNDITAGDVWNTLSSTLTTENSIGEQLAINVDETVSSRASQVSVDAFQTDLTHIRSRVDSIYIDTQHIRTVVDNILTRWGTSSIADIIGFVDEIESRLGTSADLSSVETIFGRTKFIQEKWGTQTAQEIYDAINSISNTVITEVQNELGYHGTTTTAYADLQLIKEYVDTLEGYVGTPLDNSLEDTLFGKIRNVREKLNQLDELETKLDTANDAINDIETSQSADYSDELSDIYTLLNNVSSDIEDISGDEGYDLDILYNKISKSDESDSLKDIANRIAELKTLIGVNKILITQTIDQPIIKTWFTEGSVILNILVINPPDAARMVEIKEYLPKEIRENDIIEIENGLQLEYDSNLDSYFVKGEVDLEAGERKTFKVRVEDIFKISESELIDLKQQTETLMIPLENTSYFAQASILKSETNAGIDAISRRQENPPVSIEKKISLFRDSQKDLQKIKENLESLKKIVAEVSGKDAMAGNLFGVSTTMTWAIIIIVVVGISILMILLYVILMRFRALEDVPIVDAEKQISEPTINSQRMTKLTKFLIIAGSLILLILSILLGVYFVKEKKTIGNDFSIKSEEVEETIVVTEEKNENVIEEEIEEIDSQKENEEKIKEKKLRILETEVGWLNVRSEPSLKSSILTKVNIDDEFEYINEQDGWYQIILSEGEFGWVFGEYVEIISNF